MEGALVAALDLQGAFVGLVPADHATTYNLLVRGESDAARQAKLSRGHPYETAMRQLQTHLRRWGLVEGGPVPFAARFAMAESTFREEQAVGRVGHRWVFPDDMEKRLFATAVARLRSVAEAEGVDLEATDTELEDALRTFRRGITAGQCQVPPPGRHDPERFASGLLVALRPGCLRHDSPTQEASWALVADLAAELAGSPYAWIWTGPRARPLPDDVETWLLDRLVAASVHDADPSVVAQVVDQQLRHDLKPFPLVVP